MTDRSLGEGDLSDDPVAMFDAWFSDAVAAGEPEPEAMALATADTEGVPTVRFVLLKSWGPAGFTFYTNAGSEKGGQLAANLNAALALRWAIQDRQVRVRGPVAPISDAESDAYFASRARRSQLGAWASDQSRPITGRGVLEARLAEIEARYDGAAVPRPPHWHGWRVTPTVIELWQGRDNRLHDRFRFTGGPGAWTATRLSP